MTHTVTRIDEYTQQALHHIRYLSETIGGRGSCTPNERRAAEYVSARMREMGAEGVCIEPYTASPSTYRPFALTFAVSLLGTLAVWLLPGRWTLAFAALLNALGGWGMLAETEFIPNWMRRLLPKANSQNAVGIIPAKGETRRRAVLCAHLDTHRTPVFYSSKTWHTLFGALVGGAFISMGLTAIAYGIGVAFDWSWVRWIGLAAAAMVLFALTMCLHADFTPFSPGANDDASGVGVILGLAARLLHEPLAHTEVWLALTGCEEVASYGIQAFLDAHAEELGDDAVYIILDEVGSSRIKTITADGLIVKHKSHSHALELARQVNRALPHIELLEQIGTAYTDALSATKRGLIALTVCSDPAPGKGEVSYWHQMSDKIEHINPQGLSDTHDFTWQVLQEIDGR